MYCREPTEFGSSSIRLVKAAEGWLNVRAVWPCGRRPRRVQARAVATQHDDGQSVAVADRHRNLEAHTFALGKRGIGDGLGHRQRNILLGDQSLRTRGRRQHGGNGGNSQIGDMRVTSLVISWMLRR